MPNSNHSEANKEAIRRLMDNDEVAALLKDKEKAPKLNYQPTQMDLNEEIPRDNWLVDKFLPTRGVLTMFGKPGSLKSMILLDACIAIASGQDFMNPNPGHIITNGKSAVSKKTTKTKVLWLDFDNGSVETKIRIKAICKARGLTGMSPLHHVIMPEERFMLSNDDHIIELAKTIVDGEFGVVIYDNFSAITLDLDENGPALKVAAANLQKLNDLTNALHIPIHHPTKNSSGSQDSFRGHGSVAAAMMIMLYVDRNDDSDVISIYQRKKRNIVIPVLEAKFNFTIKPALDDMEIPMLDTAWFTVPGQGEGVPENRVILAAGQYEAIKRILPLMIKDPNKAWATIEMEAAIKKIDGGGRSRASYAGGLSKAYKVLNIKHRLEPREEYQATLATSMDDFDNKVTKRG